MRLWRIAGRGVKTCSARGVTAARSGHTCSACAVGRGGAVTQRARRDATRRVLTDGSLLDLLARLLALLPLPGPEYPAEHREAALPRL